MRIISAARRRRAALSIALLFLRPRRLFAGRGRGTVGDYILPLLSKPHLSFESCKKIEKREYFNSIISVRERVVQRNYYLLIVVVEFLQIAKFPFAGMVFHNRGGYL